MADTLHLIGLPSLSEYVGYVEERLTGHERVDPMALIDGWNVAASRYEALQAEEPGIADDPRILPLPPEMAEWADSLTRVPAFVRDFSTVPVAFGLVPLDTLVVTQRRVVLDHVHRVVERVGRPPSTEMLLRTCLPREADRAALSFVRSHSDTFVFTSPSMDLRAFEPELVASDLLAGFQGTATRAVALAVGFGSNCLNVIRTGRRLVLCNGYHRSVALRAAGVTHVPCLIQAPSGGEELAMIGSDQLSDHHDVFLERARPPILRDFFDPALTVRLSLPSVRKQIQVTVKVETLRVPG